MLARSVLILLLISYEALGALDLCGKILVSGRIDGVRDVDGESLYRAFVSPDGSWACIPSPVLGQADLVELPSGRVLAPLKIEGHRIRNLTFARNGNHIVAYDGERTVAAAFSVPDAKPIWTWPVPSSVWHVRPYLSLSPDGTRLLVPGMARVDVIGDGNVIASSGDLPINPRKGLMFADNQTVLLFSKTGAPELYAIEGNSLRRIREFELQSAPFFDSLPGALSSDERFFALGEFSAGTAYVRIWDTRTGKIHRHLRFPRSKRVKALAISRDGQFLAVSELKRIRLVHIERREILANLTATIDDDSFINTVVFSPNGRRVLASLDGSAEVWEWDLSSVLHGGS